MRYRGPRLKLMRSLGVVLPGLTRKSMERKPYPPGQHGAKRKKPSEFALQLKEKQKLRYNYGVTERQLKKIVKESFRRKGEPGKNLLSLLESRLDNVVFRAGLAPTIPAARQLISHNHVKVDGKRVNISSFVVKAGTAISVSEKAKKIPSVVTTAETPVIQKPTWVEFDATKFEAKLVSQPNEEFVPFPIEINKVIEFYSRRV